MATYESDLKTAIQWIARDLFSPASQGWPGERETVSAIADTLTGEGHYRTAVVDIPGRLCRAIVLGPLPPRGVGGYPLVLLISQHRPDCVCTFCEEGADRKRLEEAGLPSGRLATSEEVAEFFRGRSQAITRETLLYPKTWAPAVDTPEFGTNQLGGDLGAPKAYSSGAFSALEDYTWFDLEETPVGGSVFHLDATPTLWLFTRREAGWEVTVVEDPQWAKTDRRWGEQPLGALIQGAQDALEAVAIAAHGALADPAAQS